MDLECPFCGTQFSGYLWSLAGRGKRCPYCGALHGHAGMAVEKPKGES